MLKIRLQRVGRKGEPAFRLVLTESQNSTKSGRFKEILGSYDPRKDTDTLNAPRIKHWIAQGAQPTDTVHNLLITHGVIEGKKRNVLPKKNPPQPSPEATAGEVVKEAEPVVEASEEISETPSKEPDTSAEAETAPAEEPVAPTE